MNFRSIKDMSVDIRNHLIPKLPDDIGIVYGIPRSGMLPASIIATTIGADLASVGSEPTSGERKKLSNRNGDKILLVDDSIYGGGAMYNALRKLNKECLTCVVYAHPKSIDKVNYYAVELDGPRFFEWNFTGIKATENYIFDMDGVICEDPKVFDNDGKEYEDEIKRVKPLYLPQVKVKAICTNRIERWRPQTEEWLRKHGILYDQLIMQQFPTAVERRKHSNPGHYKARHYKNIDAEVFVESHDWQAEIIASLSKKPVLSIESMRLF